MDLIRRQSQKKNMLRKTRPWAVHSFAAPAALGARETGVRK
jgi:hypothetical protein